MDNWLMLCGLSLMRQGSATVEADVTVTEGQRVAEVGNSASTAEPHLHIHTIDPETEVGVPIAFDGNEYRFILPGPQRSESKWQFCLDHFTDLWMKYLIPVGSLPPGIPAGVVRRIRL